MKKDQLHSRAWLGDYADLFERETKAERMARPDDAMTEAVIERVIRLAHAKRAVGNFVRIVTNQNIPVQYATSGYSKTDGKRVILNANITDKTFDAVVGTALHEAAHIKLSDFEFLKIFADQYSAMLGDARMLKLTELGYRASEVHEFVHLVMNVIEDRRIDQWIYQWAPGYRPYYKAMYKAYWHNKEIDKMLLSDLYTTPTLNNYLARLMNVSNKNFRTDALPELDKCVQIIDLPNITRLNAESARANIRQLATYTGHVSRAEYWPQLMRDAVAILDVITPYVIHEAPPPMPSPSGKGEGEAQQSAGAPSDNSEPDDSKDTDEQQAGEDSKEDGDDKSTSTGASSGSGSEGADSGADSDDASDADESQEADSGEGDEEEKKEAKSKSGDEDEEADEPDVNLDHLEDALSSEMNNPAPPPVKIDQKKLDKALENQKKFLEGDTKKKTLTSRLVKEIDSVAQSDATITEVGKGCFSGMTAKCVITRRLTAELINSSEFPFSKEAYYSTTEPIAAGIRLGNMLAQKLAIRNDSNSLKYTRQNRGHVDKRLLAQLGAGIESIFHSFKTDQFKSVFLHLSLDASGSMSGDKWNRTMTCAAAICRAAELIKNIDVTVSIRAGHDLAHIAFIYDSRRDSSRMIQSLWPRLQPFGSTPEGLTFEAILDDLTKEASHQKDLYFINISDGAPSFHLTPINAKGSRRRRRFSSSGAAYYAGNVAAEHTRDQIRMLEHAGFKIMSYYITHSGAASLYSSSRDTKDIFMKSYGPAAQFIDIVNLGGLIKTLNKLFLSKAT